MSAAMTTANGIWQMAFSTAVDLMTGGCHALGSLAICRSLYLRSACERATCQG